MNITIRNINLSNPQEVKDVRKLGAKAFFGFAFFWFLFPKPKGALLALLGDQIASCFCYKLYHTSGQKIGFISYFFTDPKHHGQGIGKQLFEQGIKQLWALDCHRLVSYVRDDNAGSWMNFIKNDFARVPFLTLIPQIGLLQSLKLYVVTTFGVAFGHDFYLSTKEGDNTQKESNSLGQILIYLFVNAVLFIPIFRAFNDLHLAFSTFFGVFIGVTVSGYIGTLFTKRKWHFRFTDGGLLLCGFFSFFWGFIPMVAGWYPAKYEKTAQFRRDMALPAMASWLFLLGIATAAAIVPALSFLSGLIAVLLLFRCMIIFEPFKTYGGQRIYDWNKAVFFVFAALSVAFVFVI